MNIKDITIDTAPYNWAKILEDWYWILPKEFDVWLLTKFGDIFCHLPDDSVHWLDTGTGKLTKIAETKEAFFQMADDPKNVDHWFLPELISSLKSRGVVLSPTECYSFTLPPGLGGKYEADNIKPCDVAVHFAISGQVFFQIKDAPDGTKIRFTTIK